MKNFCAHVVFVLLFAEKLVSFFVAICEQQWLNPCLDNNVRKTEIKSTKFSSVTLIHHLSEFFDESNSIGGKSIKFTILFGHLETTDSTFCRSSWLGRHNKPEDYSKNQAKIENFHCQKKISGWEFESNKKIIWVKQKNYLIFWCKGSKTALFIFIKT